MQTMCTPCRRFHQPQGGQQGKFQVQVSLWCLNPACIFRTIGTEARAVIVASGTLSPMVSFASELGIPFALQLEAKHVIDKKQVLAMAIAHSPSSQLIKATFQQSSTFRFQDAVGETLEKLALVVPDGLLVFMPSYGMMDKLTKRWKETGAIECSLSTRTSGKMLVPLLWMRNACLCGFGLMLSNMHSMF
jgi:fanconi anemia group J protein